MICPSCRQDVAPIVRGVRAYCTACGAPMPITSAAEGVNVVGEPAKVGGGIARVFGWLILTGGLMAFLFFALIASALSAPAVLWVGGFFAALAAIVATPILFAARKLQRSGEDREQAARERAIYALAARNRGVLSVKRVADALQMKDDDADALLTVMAKRGDGVSLEVDDDGRLTYHFRDLIASTPATKVRVGGDGWRVPPQAGVEAKPRVIDAELLDEDEPAEEKARRAVR